MKRPVTSPLAGTRVAERAIGLGLAIAIPWAAVAVMAGSASVVRAPPDFCD